MPDDPLEFPERGYNTQDVRAQKAEEPKRKRRRWGLKAALYLLLIPALTVAAWTFAARSITYSRGERVGYVQKLSEKGWICRTWEGELAMSNVPGSMPEKFYFTVPAAPVAKQLQAFEGHRVAISYEEHRGIPFSCFGETGYYVTGARDLGR
jgi:hypothetical protein